MKKILIQKNELKEYLNNNIVVKSLTELSNSKVTNDKERSKNLVYEAYDQSISKGKKLIKNAYKSNIFVIEYLLGISEIPDELPDFIGVGDENEAIAYAYEHWNLWKKTSFAFDWIYEFHLKQ